MTAQALIDQINDAIGAHGAWKMRLRTAMLTGKSDITPQVAGCDDACAFGKWLKHGTIAPAVKADVPYRVVTRLHAEFHRAAGSVLTHALSGRTGEAGQLMDGEFTERSEKLVKALNKWKRELLGSTGIGRAA